MADKNFTSNILKVFDEKINRGAIIRIQIIQWNNYSPVLEKREYYTKDEEEKMGKVKGFNHEDFQIILENSNEIQKFLEKENK